MKGYIASFWDGVWMFSRLARWELGAKMIFGMPGLVPVRLLFATASFKSAWTATSTTANRRGCRTLFPDPQPGFGTRSKTARGTCQPPRPRRPGLFGHHRAGEFDNFRHACVWRPGVRRRRRWRRQPRLRRCGQYDRCGRRRCRRNCRGTRWRRWWRGRWLLPPIGVGTGGGAGGAGGGGAAGGTAGTNTTAGGIGHDGAAAGDGGGGGGGGGSGLFSGGLTEFAAGNGTGNAGGAGGAGNGTGGGGGGGAGRRLPHSNRRFDNIPAERFSSRAGWCGWRGRRERVWARRLGRLGRRGFYFERQPRRVLSRVPSLAAAPAVRVALAARETAQEVPAARVFRQFPPRSPTPAESAAATAARARRTAPAAPGSSARTSSSISLPAEASRAACRAME